MNSEPNVRVKVDVTNPGQFFACCGLLELADRLAPGAQAAFQGEEFTIRSDATLGELVEKIASGELIQLDDENDMSSPIHLGAPFELRLDWWTDDLGGKGLKVWAGSMRNVRIARAMQQAIGSIPDPQLLFDHGTVVYDGKKKVEPFYFDSRRGQNAMSRDIGFAPDSLAMTTLAFPAVEFLCLVGLQRFRPGKTNKRRVFVYRPWGQLLPIQPASVVACDANASLDTAKYRFEVAFRTDQKKHKSFLPSTLIGAPK